MRRARDAGSELVVLPELCLTTFFARFVYDDEQELDSLFETQMPGPDTRAIFDEAKRLRLAFYLGYAELDINEGRKRRFNTSILVDKSGKIVGKYRKVHVPGYAEPRPEAPFANLEKRYFEPGDLGFPVRRFLGGYAGMCICNDRRWPETYRVMGLQGVEMILLGYNTAALNYYGREPAHLAMLHNHLVMQSGAYQNSTYVVAAAKCGVENGISLIGGSCIISPFGEIIARAQTEDDEVITATCDLDLCLFGKRTMFDFEANRRPEAYELITRQKGVKYPD